MSRLVRLFSLLCLLGSILPVGAENWQDYRGPTRQGLYGGKDLPIEWSTTKNVVWKQPIAGKGWSSPIVQAGRIYLTSAVPVGDKESKDQSLQAICLDAATGSLIWQKEVFHQDAKAQPVSRHRRGSPFCSLWPSGDCLPRF